MISQVNAAVVVLGAMNPAIHSPHWYRAVGLIEDADVEAATASSSGFMVTPHASQFITTKFRIHCTADRWQVRIDTDEDDALLRAFDVAKALFDSRLNHTPIKAAGLNIAYNIELSDTYIARSTTKALHSVFSFIPSDAVTSFETRWRANGYERRVKVDPTAADSLFLHTNAHFSFGDGEAFTLAEYIDDKLDSVSNEAKEIAQKVMDASVEATSDEVTS